MLRNKNHNLEKQYKFPLKNNVNQPEVTCFSARFLESSWTVPDPRSLTAHHSLVPSCFFYSQKLYISIKLLTLVQSFPLFCLSDKCPQIPSSIPTSVPQSTPALTHWSLVPGSKKKQWELIQPWGRNP